MSAALVRRFRRLVVTPGFPHADAEMAEVLAELRELGHLELGRQPRRDAYRRIQRLVIHSSGGIDGAARLGAALSDLGLTGSQ